MMWLTGRPMVVADPPEWQVIVLAEVLAEIHSLPAEWFEFLPRWDLDRALELEGNAVVEWFREIGVDGRLAIEVLAGGAEHVTHEPVSFLHWDYWPGNALWSRGRLTGVVDWQTAALGDARYDVAYCRQDLLLFAGERAVRTFTRAYEAARGRPVNDLWFWDLFATLRPLPDPRAWLSGYEQLERTDLSVAETVRRLRRIIEQALAEAMPS